MVMRALLLPLLLLAPCALRAAQALIVISEPLTPSYREALDGFLAEWGEPVETAPAGRALPPGRHGVIVALGGHAALRARRRLRASAAMFRCSCRCIRRFESRSAPTWPASRASSIPRVPASSG